jgi:fimbrial chaperone protein
MPDTNHLLDSGLLPLGGDSPGLWRSGTVRAMLRLGTRRSPLPSCTCRLVALLLAVLTLSAVTAPVRADGGLVVSPTSLTFPYRAETVSLTLENRGTGPLSLRADVMRWEQRSGLDQLIPSEDLEVRPMILTVEPGGIQALRIDLKRPPDPNLERAYRLMVYRVAPSLAPGEAVTPAPNPEADLPVFVQPPIRPTLKLAWDARTVLDGTISLTLVNEGDVHVRIDEVQLQTEEGLLLVGISPGLFVLAGQTRVWTTTPTQPWRGAPLRLTVRTATGTLSTLMTP